MVYSAKKSDGQTRLFVPAGDGFDKSIDKLMKDYPAESIDTDYANKSEFDESYSAVDEGNLAHKTANEQRINELANATARSRGFNVVIDNSGEMRVPASYNEKQRQYVLTPNSHTPPLKYFRSRNYFHTLPVFGTG